MSPWIWNCSPLTTPPKDAVGFVYEITNDLNGRRYIGQKHFHSHRTKKLPHRKNRKHYTVESDWRSYWGSCDELTADVERYGVDNFSREIVRLCFREFELSYYEAKELFDRDALLKPDQYYNANILRSVFRPRTNGNKAT